MTRVWVHTTGPVDSWYGWHPRAAYLAELASTGGPQRYATIPTTVTAEELDGLSYDADRLAQQWDQAEGFARQAGWDSHGRTYVSMLPDPDRCSSMFLFAFKNGGKGGNGTCYFVAPVRLPWVEDDVYGPAQQWTCKGEPRG